MAPGWVAILAALVCLLPRIGFVDARAFGTEVNYASLFYTGGLLGLVSMIDATGLGGWFGEALLGRLPLTPEAPFRSFMAVVLLGSVISAVTVLAGVSAVMAPLAAPISAATGFPLLTSLMIPVITFSAIFLPYQAAPLAVALQLGGVPLARVARLSLPLAAVTVLVLAPLQFLWWWALGMLAPI